jgi:type IV secretion system protein VirB5
MKKIFLIFFVFFGFFMSSHIYADEPVIDVAAIAQAVEQLDQLKKQYDELTKQYDELHEQTGQLKKEYDSMTGIRDFTDVLRDESFKDNLPLDWNGTYDNIRERGYDGLTKEAQDIYKRNKIYDKCQSITAIDEKKICEAQSVKSAQDQAFALEALQKSKARMDNISNLLDQVKRTQDPKGIADLQARMAIEQSLIANDQAKLQMFKMAAEAEDKAQKQRQQEIDARTFSSNKFNNPPPITFGSE